MKNLAAILLSLALAVPEILAQDYREAIISDPQRAASNLYGYEYEATPQSDAPKGYKAFYINHYSRHGSRYMSSDLEASAVRPVFEKAEACGILTEKGKVFWEDLKAVLDEQEGVVGMLTTKGVAEHYGIGERMALNYPEVFRAKSGRNKVNCVISTSPRCIISMTSFTDALQANTKGLEYSYITGAKYYAYLAYHPQVQEGLELSGDKEMEFRRANCRPEELLSEFFTDLSQLTEEIGDIYKFERRFYLLCCVGHLTDHGKCLLEYFPHDHLILNWEARNARFYLAYSNSKELPHYASDVAKPLLNEMLMRIDSALAAGSDVAADLSFGHDVTLMPLISHIGIRGMHEKLSFEEVNGRWDSADFICMGSNIQMIFYKNKAGDILVKLLYNEKETDIPALRSFVGNYYRWDDLRAYLVALNED